MSSGEADERVGMSGVLGQLVGRVRTRWVEAERGWAGLRGLPLLFLFLFYFSSPLFEFQFGLKFEFKIGVP